MQLVQPDAGKDPAVREPHGRRPTRLRRRPPPVHQLHGRVHQPSIEVHGRRRQTAARQRPRGPGGGVHQGGGHGLTGAGA
ncbi:putative cytidine deaminase [Streptomyces sp. Tu6071]|nr:putative cytidine deaminase [Streptomyces sp. Tu6071]